MAKDAKAYDVADLGFRVAVLTAAALVLSSLVAVGISLHNGAHPASGAPLASLDAPQLLTVAASHRRV